MRVSAFLRRIPLLCGLADCTSKDHWEAIQELLFTLFGTTLPIIIGGWVLTITLEEYSFYQAITKTISNGELFLYTTSLITPIIYMATASSRNGIEFPSKRSHISLVIGLIIFSSITFALQRAGLTLNFKSIFPVSIVFFIASIFLLYLAITYKNRLLPKSPEDMRLQETSFSHQFGTHR